MPAVQLALVGNSLPPQLGLNQAGVRRVGYVADLSETFGACRIAASPVRFGTGIKTKNLLALAHGVPLVTTAVGADGLDLRDGHTALIANSAQEFSTAIVKAYGDENLWDKLSREGRGQVSSILGIRKRFIHRCEHFNPPSIPKRLTSRSVATRLAEDLAPSIKVSKSMRNFVS
jgi:glycosyltransferase involved in cell wall biosynthesis